MKNSRIASKIERRFLIAWYNRPSTGNNNDLPAYIRVSSDLGLWDSTPQLQKVSLGNSLQVCDVRERRYERDEEDKVGNVFVVPVMDTYVQREDD
ncbi:hypothetical protein Lser_V15G26653 [Lactuca serriola]